MGYLTNGLTFNALRGAICARLPEFKNARGEPAHSEPDGSDWPLSAWSNAVLGELGEAANIIKKVERGDLTLDEARPALAKEFADVATYLDILAFRAGVDLGRATIDKFNEVSDRVGSRVYLSQGDSAQPAAVLTCVYCGHEYPQGTPPAGNEVLTDHIRRCAKHPLRKAEATIKVLRDALAGVVGASDAQQLRGMELAMRTLPAPDEDKAVTINAIRALLETSEGAQ